MNASPSPSLVPLPIVAFDEAGNTGQNLLDPDQPVFALASVHLSEERARALVAAAAPGHAEAKFSLLRSSRAGRERLLHVLRDEELTTAEVRVAAYHKTFMVTTKIVDMLVETWHHRHGVDLYKNAANLGLANVLHHSIPVYCGDAPFRQWLSRFVAMVREKSPTNVEAFYAQTAALQDLNRDPEFDIFLKMLGWTRATVDEGVKEADRVAVDPAIPTLVQLAAQWTATLETPFDLVHDASKPIQYSLDDLQHLFALDEPLQVFEGVGLPEAYPIWSPGIRFADSRDVPQLQVADLFAGASLTLLKARARHERDPFAEQWDEAGIGELITSVIWPDTAVSPADLDADRRAGSRQLDFVFDLARRRRAQRSRDDT